MQYSSHIVYHYVQYIIYSHQGTFTVISLNKDSHGLCDCLTGSPLLPSTVTVKCRTKMAVFIFQKKNLNHCYEPEHQLEWFTYFGVSKKKVNT